MTFKQTTIPLLILLVLFVVGSAFGSNVITKKPVKLVGDKIPKVVSNQAVLKSKDRLMQSPGTVLDSSYYDWQRNGGLDDHLAIFDDGGTVKINGTMMISYLQDWSDRTMNYYFWDGTGWSGAGQPVYTTRNGFGSLTQLSDGSVIVSAHTDDGLGFRCFSAVDAGPGQRNFSYYGTSLNILQIWPRITTTSDGSVVITGTNQGAINGITNHVTWAKAPDSGSPFGEWNLVGDIAPDWMDNDMEWPTIGAGDLGYVGMAIPDVAGAVRYFHSFDNGDSFIPVTIASADTAGLPTDLDSTAARLGWINTDVMFEGAMPHVVWTAGQGLNTGFGTYGIADFKSTIYHWSPATGVDEVVVAWVQSADDTRPDYVQTPYNHLSVDWPSIGLAADGHTLVVAFVGFSTDDIDPNSFGPVGAGVGYCDIYVTASADDGETWSAPVNVTNPDGTFLGWDDRYPSIAKVNMDNAADPGKDVYMIYQSDDLGGTSVQGTEGGTNMDYMKFIGIDLGMILSGPVPGVAGEINDFVVSGATPGENVYFVYGFAPGSTPVPGCPGETVDITAPTIFGIAAADADGIATVSTFVPGPASGLTIRLQAVDLAGCQVSNLVVHEFQ